MTAVRAFCIRMRCNLSAVSSCKSYLTGPGHRSGNDSVLFRYCPHLKIAPLAIELKGFRSHAHEGLSCPSFIHFQATDAVRLSTSWCLSQPLLFSRSLRIIWEKFSPRDYPWYFREPARHPVPRLLICQSFIMSPGQTQVWHCGRSVKQDWTRFFFLIKLLKGPLLLKRASAQPLTLFQRSKKADNLQSFEITILQMQKNSIFDGRQWLDNSLSFCQGALSLPQVKTMEGKIWMCPPSIPRGSVFQNGTICLYDKYNRWQKQTHSKCIHNLQR